MPEILILFHNASNSGFASKRHEVTFTKMAYCLTGDYNKIHFAYTDLDAGRSISLPAEIINIIQFNSRSDNKNDHEFISEYIKSNDIKICFGFDLPVRRPAYKAMRRAGMQYLISYVGAPMSSLNAGITLLLKRMDTAFSFCQPDHYIFQSEGMRKTATHGRGIPLNKTSVVRSGADPEIFCPPNAPDFYAHEAFGIDKRRKIVFFSGNMEPRKGVDVIVQTAAELVNKLQRRDIHFLLVGNRWQQAEKLLECVRHTEAEKFITFGGYREDVPRLLKSCCLGMIASTGWDSYPMSAVEMASVGLPIILSDLPGLREAITPQTGFRFPVGDFRVAAQNILTLIENPALRNEMGAAARRIVLSTQTVEHQAIALGGIVRRVAGAVL